MKKISVFLSYHRKSSSDLARQIHDYLCDKGVDVFFDVEDINGGRFETQIRQEITSRDNFLIILSPQTLGSEWVQKELKLAIRFGKNIIPILMPEFSFASDVPPTVQDITNFGGIHYDYKYPEGAYRRIDRALELRSSSLLATLHKVGKRVAVIIILISLIALLYIVGTSSNGELNPQVTETSQLSSTFLPQQTLLTTQIVAATEVQTTVDVYAVRRLGDTLSICMPQTTNIQNVTIKIGLNTSYILGHLFETQHTPNGCWCLKQSNSTFPYPSQCTLDNSRVVDQVSDWRDKSVELLLDEQAIGICESQSILGEYQCTFPSPNQ